MSNTLRDDLLEAGIDITANHTRAKEQTKQILIICVATVVFVITIFTALAIHDYTEHTSKVECVKHAADVYACVEMFKTR